MTDEDLRALERAARATPGDVRVGWSFVRGLERAGEERRAFLERCRLARLGDEEALALVAPRPAPGLRGGAKAVAKRPGRGFLSGGAGRVYACSEAGALEVFGVDLSPLWTAPTRTSRACPRGADVVLLLAHSLELRDGTSGDLLASSPLPDDTLMVDTFQDRAVAIAGSDRGARVAVGLDLGERFGAELWRHGKKTGLASASYSPSRTYSVGQKVEHVKFGEGKVKKIVDSKKVLIEFASGEKTLAQNAGGEAVVAWKGRPRKKLLAKSAWCGLERSLVGSDRKDLLDNEAAQHLDEWDQEQDDEAVDEVECVHPETGELVWLEEMPDLGGSGPRRAADDEEHDPDEPPHYGFFVHAADSNAALVELASWREGDERLVLLDGKKGTTLWENRGFVRRTHHALAEERVVVVDAHSVVALDRATGKLSWEHELDGGPPGDYLLEEPLPPAVALARDLVYVAHGRHEPADGSWVIEGIDLRSGERVFAHELDAPVEGLLPVEGGLIVSTTDEIVRLE